MVLPCARARQRRTRPPGRTPTRQTSAEGLPRQSTSPKSSPASPAWPYLCMRAKKRGENPDAETGSSRFVSTSLADRMNLTRALEPRCFAVGPAASGRPLPFTRYPRKRRSNTKCSTQRSSTTRLSRREAGHTVPFCIDTRLMGELRPFPAWAGHGPFSFRKAHLR